MDENKFHWPFSSSPEDRASGRQGLREPSDKTNGAGDDADKGEAAISSPSADFGRPGRRANKQRVAAGSTGRPAPVRGPASACADNVLAKAARQSPKRAVERGALASTKHHNDNGPRGQVGQVSGGASRSQKGLGATNSSDE